jgi:hypothetical protein
MKTKLTILLVGLICFCQNATSQIYRYADLSVKFTSPVANTQYTSPTTIAFEFQVTNQGPDTIFTTDTIYYSPSHSFSGWRNERRKAFPKVLNPHDSITFSDTISINASSKNKNFHLAFGQVPMAFGPDNGKMYLQNEFSEDRHDNMADVSLYHNGNLDIEDKLSIEVNAYPNPVNNGLLTISTQRKIESIKMFNTLSQEVYPSIIRSSTTEMIVSVTHLAPGIYNAYIKRRDGVKVERIVIN